MILLNLVKKTDFDKKLKNGTSNKNELNELSKKVKVISRKGLTKINLIFSMEQNVFLQECFKII